MFQHSVEFVRNKTEILLSKETSSQQSVEGIAWFHLTAYSKWQEQRNEQRRNNGKQNKTNT